MKICDRGTKKWVSLLLPEHVRELRKSLIDESKISKPILDEQEIEIMEELVLKAIEHKDPLLFSIFADGFIKTIRGRVHFIDHIKKEIRLKDDESKVIQFVRFNEIVNIEKEMDRTL